MHRAAILHDLARRLNGVERAELPSLADMIAYCLCFPSLLEPRELEFLHAMRRRPRHWAYRTPSGLGR